MNQKLKKMKKITFLFVALAVILFGACSPSAKTPSGAVKIYSDYIKTENFDKAVECIYLEDESTSKEQLLEIAEKLKTSYAENGKNNFDKIEIVSEEIDGDNATVEVKEFFKDGTEETNTYKLRKNENGEWKIDLFAK